VLRYQQDFLRYAVVDETFLRFTSVERFHRGAPVYFYPLTFLWALAPWSVLMVAMLPEFRQCWREETMHGAALRFAIRVAVTMLVFFTLSASKRPQYMLPAAVPLAIACAIVVVRNPGRAAASLGLVGAAAALSGAALAVAGAPGLRRRGYDRAAASAAGLAAGGFLFLGWGLLVLASRWLGAWPAIACAALLSPPVAMICVGTLAPWTDTRSARGLATLLPPGAHV